MKKQKIKAGKYVVLKKNGNTTFSKKCDKGMLIEAPDSVEILEKTSLTKEEKEKEK